MNFERGSNLCHHRYNARRCQTCHTAALPPGRGAYAATVDVLGPSRRVAYSLSFADPAAAAAAADAIRAGALGRYVRDAPGGAFEARVGVAYSADSVVSRAQ